jgi:hypothetical protein
VFELTPDGHGGWSEKVLDSFADGGNDPRATVIIDAAGNLYGTAANGGIGYGLVFEITP